MKYRLTKKSIIFNSDDATILHQAVGYIAQFSSVKDHSVCMRVYDHLCDCYSDDDDLTVNYLPKRQMRMLQKWIDEFIPTILAETETEIGVRAREIIRQLLGEVDVQT